MLIPYILCFLEFISYYILMKKFSGQSFKPTETDIPSCFLITFLIGSIPENSAITCWALGQIVYLCYFYWGTALNKRLDRFFLYILTYVVLIAIQFFAALILSLCPIVRDAAYIGIWGNLLVIGISLLLCLCKLSGLFKFITEAAIPFRFVLLNTYLILVIILIVFKVNPSRLYTNIGTVLVTTIILMIANASVLYYDQKMNLQKLELLSYQKNLPIYESLIKEIRNNQHEYSNRLQNLQTLTSTCKDYEELRKCVQTYTYEYMKPLHAYPLLQINMPLLAATLYNLSCQAEANNITIQFDVVSDKLVSQASETDLSDYLSILTQNAIEACSPGDSIYIHLSSTDNQIRFEIRNPVTEFISSEEITNFFKNGYTTKANDKKPDGSPHGFGLYTLLKSVTKQKGVVGADCIEHDGKIWMIMQLKI